MSVPPVLAHDCLQKTAAAHGDDRGILFHPSLDTSEFRGYADLDRRSRAIAHALTEQDIGVGDRVVIALSPGLGWVDAVFGALYAGAAFVPTPVAGYGLPPAMVAERVGAISRAAGASVIIADETLAAVLAAADIDIPIAVLSELLDTGDADAWMPPAIDADAIAWLFFTSGSTGDPKGVMGTHRALRATADAASELIAADETSTLVGWLPLHHAMGLMMQVLVPAVNGGKVVLTTTEQFQRRPMSWLHLMSTHRATLTLAGNFAFDLCVKFATDAQVAELDLSAVRCFVSGSEPVRPSTVAAFTQRFASTGLDPATVAPAFGMTEAMFITSKPLGVPYTVSHVDADRLATGEFVPSAAEDAVELISCGVPSAETRLAIVDPDTLEAVPEGVLGEIWISSPAVSPGYFRRPEATAETFGYTLAGDDEAYVRSGDLGSIVDGELYVTGRLKDVIILRGRNIHPQDIESAAAALSPALGVGAAFELETGQRIALVIEYDPELAGEPVETLLERLEDELVTRFSLPAIAIGLVSAGGVPRTPTGKVRRAPARGLVASGAMPYLHAVGLESPAPAAI